MSDAPTPVPAVRVTDVDIPFGSMMVLMIKWALAAIPALIILTVLGAVIAACLAIAGLGLR